MTKLKSIRLENFCGYRETKINFANNSKINKANVFYGPNGCGKSTLLNAIRILTNPHRYQNRDCTILFNKLVFDKNYEPSISNYKSQLSELIKKSRKEDPENPLYKDIKLTNNLENKNKMYVEGVFSTEEGDKIVSFDKKTIVKNELPYKESGHSYYVDADHPLELNNFQLEDTKLKNVFLELAGIVYDYPVKLGRLYDSGSMKYYTDISIEKWGTTVHHKAFSAGEKKICALLKELCNINYIPNTDIILIDNVEMHIYYSRHAKMFDALMEIFSEYQFFLTTHSGTLINHIENKNPNFLYDLWKFKKLEFNKFNIDNNE